MDFKNKRILLHNIHHQQFLFLIVLCLCCFSFCIVSTQAANSITQGQTLRDGQRLVSPSQIFVLGFFPKGSSGARYLGIWLNTTLSMNPVWVANRDVSISDTNGVLSLQSNGVLRIERGDRNPIVLNSNQAASPSSNVTATLLDSGNFVLTERGVNGDERLLWQSFDYPTDTLLPGMKLSINSSKTGQARSLTSWLSNKVPYSGSFSLGVGPKSNQLLMQMRGQNYWRSGEWNGTNFGLQPNLTTTDDFTGLDKIIKFSFVSDKDERYFTYNYSQSGAGLNLPILFWILNSEGVVSSREMLRDALYSDSATIGCKIGGEIRSGGCERLKLPECRSGEEQFEQRRGTMEMQGPPQGFVNQSEGLSDCDAKCRSNCSCIAYAPYNRDDQVGCQYWFHGSRFVENTGSQAFDVYLLSTSHGKKMQWWVWLIIVGSVVSALILLVSLSYYWWKKGKREESEEDVLLELQTISSGEEHGKGTPEFQLFSYDSIVSATGNFSSANKLGEGGFGPVYKGRLHEGQEIAVKRLSKSSGQGLKEFKNEIVLIAKLQHMNLVRLLGCSIKGEEKMLIYEYMPNKSLDSSLFDPAGRKLLDWRKRINIIEGIAQGLLYLHKYSRLRVIHRDLKASNILLDAEMNPKISDFGMARIFGHNDSEVNTNRIVGTYGYMSPEYAMEGIFSVKFDVFSFGVLLLEIVSGRKNSGFNHADGHTSLIRYAWDLWQKNVTEELMDPTLLDSSCPRERFLRCVHVGLLCVQESAADRPTMLDVVSMLTNETMSLPSPRQPAFSIMRSLLEEEERSKAKSSQSCSQNSVTISVMEAR